MVLVETSSEVLGLSLPVVIKCSLVGFCEDVCWRRIESIGNDAVLGVEVACRRVRSFPVPLRMDKLTVDTGRRSFGPDPSAHQPMLLGLHDFAAMAFAFSWRLGGML